jgi:predicted metal-dependent enzyme (double-stranded beta helix superfamily)
MDGTVMETPQILADGIAALREAHGEMDLDRRWARISAILAGMLAKPDLQQAAAQWPDRQGTRPQNLLFYEDPDYGFVLNGLVKQAHEGTTVHDHGHCWTAYGVLSGTERITRYAHEGERLAPAGDAVVAPGHVDLVRPGEIHAEIAGDTRTVALIIRSEKVGSFPQGMFDPESGRTWTAPGPEQIPWTL